MRNFTPLIGGAAVVKRQPAIAVVREPAVRMAEVDVAHAVGGPWPMLSRYFRDAADNDPLGIDQMRHRLVQPRDHHHVVKPAEERAAPPAVEPLVAGLGQRPGVHRLVGHVAVQKHAAAQPDVVAMPRQIRDCFSSPSAGRSTPDGNRGCPSTRWKWHRGHAAANSRSHSAARWTARRMGMRDQRKSKMSPPSTNTSARDAARAISSRYRWAFERLANRCRSETK